MSSSKDKISVITLAGNRSCSGLEQWVSTLLSEEVMLPIGKNRSQGLDSHSPAAMCSQHLLILVPRHCPHLCSEGSSSSQSANKMKSCLWSTWHIVGWFMLTLSLLNERPLNAIEDHHVLPLLLWVKLHGKGLHVLSQFQFSHKNNRTTTFLALSILEAQPVSNTIINLAGLQNAVSNLGIIVSSSLYVYLFFSISLFILPFPLLSFSSFLSYPISPYKSFFLPLSFLYSPLQLHWDCHHCLLERGAVSGNRFRSSSTSLWINT